MSLFHRLLQRLMTATAFLVCSAPGTIVTISILMAGLGLYMIATRFDVVNDTSDLLSDAYPQKQDFNHLTTEFGSDARFLVLIQAKDTETKRRLADEVGAYLQTLTPQVSNVIARIDYSSIKPRLLFTRDLPELNKIADRVEAEVKAARGSDTNSGQILLDLNSILKQANDKFNSGYLQESGNWKDFLPFVKQFVSVLNKASAQAEGANSTEPAKTPDNNKPADNSTDSSDLDSEENLDVDTQLRDKEYFSLANGALLVTAYPGEHEKGGDTPYANTVRTIRAHFLEMEKANPGASIQLTGEPALDLDQITDAQNDTTHAAVLTLLLILGLFFLSYKTMLRPALTFFSLIVAVLWSLGFSLAVVGPFNILSVAVIPMVLGIGIDFGIQILGRYEEELSRGQTVRDAIRQALEHTGIAIITGGSTTAAAFFTLCLSDFIGLSQLGSTAGASMILCMLGSLILLPALFYLRDRNGWPETLKNSSSQLAWRFLKTWDKDLVRYPWIWVVGSVILSVASILSLSHLRFDYNLLHLQSASAPSVKVLQQLMDATKVDVNGKESETSTIYASVVVDNLDQAKELTDKLKALPVVSKVDSVLEILPSDGDTKLPVVKRIVTAAKSLNFAPASKAPIDLGKARKDVASLLDKATEGQKQAHGARNISSVARQADTAFSTMVPALARLKKALSADDTTLVQRFSPSHQGGAFTQLQKNVDFLKTQLDDRAPNLDDVPEALKKLFVGKTGKILLQVYGKKDLWEAAPDKEFVDSIIKVANHATGTPVLNYYATDLLIESYLKAAGWAFVAILVLILLHFQSFKYLILTVTPLVLAVLWRTGLMVLVGIEFNPANIVTLPLIIGIDVAFGIYIVDRFREDGEMRIFSASTGKAIIMSALTSFFGFVSLLIAQFRGVHSIGVLMSLGIAIGLVTSILILPQILVLLPDKRPVKSPNS